MSDESDHQSQKDNLNIERNTAISTSTKVKTLLKLVRISLVVVIPVLLILTTFAGDTNYGLLSVLLIILSMIPFFLRFERRKPQARELVVIAVMATLAALGRVMFAPIPFFKPTSAIVIITAIAFGPEAGFLTGAVSAVASNLFLGQGPWTPWQMFCWGMMGFGAGIISKALSKNRLGLSIYGFLSSFLFGWVMNIWFIIGYVEPIIKETFIAAYITSFWFDFTHGISTVIFIILLSKSWIKKLNRVKLKYGLLE